MKKAVKYSILIFLAVISCHTKDQMDLPEKWKQEIANTEKEFADRVAQNGIGPAFLEFAAPDAVLMRNDSLLIGRESIAGYLKETPANGRTIELSWKPDFVDVARSGDLGYTYGKYVFTATDTLGISRISEGIFHTVWKRQPDGRWRFVWD